MSVNKFLAVWCCDGLEVLFDLTTWEKNRMWKTLKGEADSDELPNLNAILLRARVNSQRQYEVYIFETADLDYETVNTVFEEDTQFIVDFIRKNGSVIYSDYHPGRKKIS